MLSGITYRFNHSLNAAGAKAGEPFFLYLPFNAVHWPLQAPPEDVAEFDNENPDRNIYLGMLKRMDLAVGVVLDELEKHDLKDNTLLLFYSDNGGSKKVFADNGTLRDYKQSTYEGGVRVPFMVSWPAVLGQGSQVDEAAISLDFFPTICEAAGLPLPEGKSLDGKSLLPLLKGEQQGSFHERLYWDGDEGRIGMRSGDWKLVGRANQYQLFDLSSDPGEQKDLAGMFPEKLAKLTKINQYHVQLFAEFIERLASTPEGDGTLLDNSMILYGSGIGDGNRHNHHELPIILMGKGGGTLKPGRHVRYPKNTPLNNLYLAMLERMGAPCKKLGDSTARLNNLYSSKY